MTEQTTTSTPPPWHQLAPDAVLAELGTDRGGLSSSTARERQERHGPNTIEVSEPTPWWQTLGRQFLSPLIAILVLANVVTALLQEWVDAVAIFLVLMANAVIGFWQERKAESAVRALQQLSAPSSRVLRDGREVRLPAAELVPGDVVPLESGERVPADLRLLDVTGLEVNESMLSGEVLPVRKDAATMPDDTPATDRTNLAFSGTLVTSGRALGVVVATGSDTELGEINRLIQSTETTSPLQALMNGLERRIGLVVALGAAFVFVAGLVLGYAPSEMFRTAVALAVASVPESLPIVLTVAMSLGVARMARHNAIVRSLPAVETLGSTTVIASDKTGTLTQNRMTVQVVWTADGATDLRIPLPHPPSGTLREALRTAGLTNEASATDEDALDLHGDAVDVALARVALASGAVTPQERTAPPLAHGPYESALRYSQTVRREPDGTRILHVKGSPDVLAAMSASLATAAGPVAMDDDAVARANERLAGQGMRVIASAQRVLAPDEEVDRHLPAPSGLTFLGLHGMEDPPRPGVVEAVADCRRAGIHVTMVTGDHPATAASIAERLGLPMERHPLVGSEIAELDDETLAARLRRTSVAARVTPQDKLRIVELLQKHGETVAVTGDGVNDAPALKAASIGVAMGASGTDVAREAADIVLTDDNFVTIVDAVRQGRVTFSAIRNATFFLIATGLASLLSVSANVLAEGPLLFLPIQLLFVNVVTNGLQDIAMGFEPAEGDELTRPPRPRSEGILSRVLWFRVLLAGVWMAVAILVAFRWALGQGYELDHARTFAITLFVLMNFYLVGTARSETRSVFALHPFSNRVLIGCALSALALHLGAMSWSVSAGLLGFTPLSAGEWLACAVLGLSVLLLIEGDKALRARVRRTRPEREHEPV